MPKYIVTGGESGEAEIEIKGKTYSPGDTVDLSGSSDKWLVDQGYLRSTTKAEPKKGTK